MDYVRSFLDFMSAPCGLSAHGRIEKLPTSDKILPATVAPPQGNLNIRGAGVGAV
jgi:hypothetical protein